MGLAWNLDSGVRLVNILPKWLTMNGFKPQMFNLKKWFFVVRTPLLPKCKKYNSGTISNSKQIWRWLAFLAQSTETTIGVFLPSWFQLLRNLKNEDSDIMIRNTFVLLFWSVSILCEQLTPEWDKIISLEKIENEEVLANWENYKLGKMPNDINLFLLKKNWQARVQVLSPSPKSNRKSRRNLDSGLSL